MEKPESYEYVISCLLQLSKGVEVILKSRGTEHESMHGSKKVNGNNILQSSAQHLNSENQKESTTAKGLRRREPNRCCTTFERLKNALEKATKKKRRKNKSINKDHQEKMENLKGVCAKGSRCLQQLH